MSTNRFKAIEALSSKIVWTTCFANKPKRELVGTCSITSKVNSDSSLVFFLSTILKSSKRFVRFYFLIIAYLIYIVDIVSSVVLVFCPNLFYYFFALVIDLSTCTFAIALLFLYRVSFLKSCKPNICPFEALLASIFKELALELCCLISKQIASCRARIKMFVISNLLFK